ncbi:MAG: T9SS type A sorting domain-containing protein [Bacteroidales bacterium]|nr:T9SS type A sorting domain-containing protein [Bacteroidales bacterium]
MKKQILILISLFVSFTVIAQTETYTPAVKYKVNNNSTNVKSAKTCGWFLQFLYPTWDNTGEAGCESDGTYFYTTRWNLNLYYRYDINGNYLATFDIPGTSSIRDLAYDGNYFYGSPVSNTVYEMDFTPGFEALISSWNMPAGITVRSIAYVPPPTDAFYVSDWAGNESWSLVTRDNGSGSGTLILEIPITSHQVNGNWGLAYDDISPGGPYLWGLCQSFDPTQINGCHLVQVEIATGLQTGVWRDIGNDPQVNIPGGSAGGCFIEPLTAFPGTVSLCGNIQNNALFGYDLASTIPMDWDVSPTTLITPVNSNILGTAEIIEVEIINNGNFALTNVPINYTVDGDAVVSETWTGNLASQARTTYAFTQTADFSTLGDHNICIYTTLAMDQCLDNDTLHSIVTNTYGQYCNAGANTCNDEYIERVEVGNIDNSSGNGCPLGYTNFTNLCTSITAGISVPITVTNGNPWASDIVTVWIDYNKDGDFTDPFEDKSLPTSDGGLTFSGNLMPNNFNTVLDTSTMRIRLQYGGVPTPCGNTSYGEVEDYSVILIPGTPCIFSCASGATPELEPCGFEWNGGCNMVIPAYQDLFPGGEIVCGTAWYDGTTRDTDWYRFVLTTSKIITIKCDAEFLAFFGIVDINNGCTGANWYQGSAYGLTTGVCVTPLDSIQWALPPGEYVAFCAPDFAAAAFSCADSMQYNLHFIVNNPPPPCDVVCPAGATLEFEPCGDHLNDGCNMAVPAYQDIAFNETVCGQAYISNTTRDTDWYKFTINANSEITFTVESEFVADVAIVDISDGCGNEQIIAFDNIDSCELVDINMQMAPGTYALFIGVDFGMLGWAPCGSKNDYVVTLTHNGPLTSYCDELYSFGCVNGIIDTFQINTIVNNGSGCSQGGYSDFTTMATNLEAGLEYPLNIATNNDDEYISMWIDFNDNFYFDANEIIIEDFWAESGNHIYTVSVIIPYTATPGSHRLRIRINNAASSADPCALYDYGEAEDYMVNITPPGPCNVVCPPNAIAELESCGYATNNGCDMPLNPAYEDIHDNDIICGTAWFDGFFRDTDWYKFEVDYNTPITLKVKSEFDYEMTFFDITTGCPAVLLEQEFNYACDIGTISYFFYPGTYVAMIGPDVNGSTINCINDNEYWLELDFVWDPPCVVDCPPTATMELEACGDSTNDGCNLQAPTFGNIANGEVIYGTAWKNQISGHTTRDTDWYLFNITETSDVSILGQSEFDCQVAIIDIPSCQSSTVMTTKNIDVCTDFNVKYQGLPPGTYVAFIAPQAGDTMSFVSWNNHYKIELLVEGPTWCHSSAIDPYDSKIDSVSFNTIMHGSSDPNCRMYSDFTSISTDVKIGFTYPLSVQTGTCQNDLEKGVKVYIDWNTDHDFYDPGEEVAAFGPDVTPMTYNTTVTVPLNAMSGATTRMRVVCRETSDMNLIDPCGEYPYGETEDYTISITPRIVTYTGQTHEDTVRICAGNVVIPVMADEVYNVAGISMELNINPAILSYSTVQNIHPELQAGNLIVFQAGAAVKVSWINPIGTANIGFGTMFELVFNATPGQSPLIWDIVNIGECEYSDPNLNVLASTWIDGLADAINCSTIDGILSYADTLSPHQAMNATTVYLMDNLVPVDSTVTDVIGYYYFDVLQNGVYTIGAASSKQWGGGNASDALAIMRHYVGLNLLSGLAVEAADVDASGFSNTLDALYVAQRFVMMIPSFPAGDWAFEVPTVTVDGTGPIYQDFFALCYGDVNASYIVPFVKSAPTITLDNIGVKEIRANEEFEVAVSVLNNLEVGAISLVLDYPKDKLEVQGVRVNTPNGNLLYNAIDGQLRISWYNLEPVSLSANEALLTLELKAIGSVENVNISLDGISELGDKYATVIQDVTLHMPKLQAVPGSPDDYSLSYNHPNPFNKITQIEYKLPEAGNVNLTVFNLLGEQVEVLVNQMQSEGTYKIDYDGSNLVPGVYLYKMEVKGATKDFVKTRMMVVTE